ncbi:glycosyltransferase family 4 protein [Candidatus Beckwithbacteria bacterium]|nr:glycosyltransferase family 4 protein [Candidatus Beckwithbacteria bacterium]
MLLRIALVHDYLNEFGGAERVLKVLSDMYPEAPIYTAFVVKSSSAHKVFKDRKIIESSLAPILKFHKLYSPLRFLAPQIWGSFNFTGFDVVISSASWYITKGIKVPKTCKHICYCHTPPRFLYGFETSIEWQRYFWVRLYARLVNSYLKKYDFQAAQTVDQFVVNSENVQQRVRQFYGKSAEIIYPPINSREIIKKTKGLKKQDYYLIVSRIVGSKGIDMAMKVFSDLKLPLKIVGEKAGLRWEDQKIEKLKAANIEFLGRLSDEKLWQIYAKAKGFLALARDEDFGMTLVEAQAAGTPVLAFYGGGYKETVVDSKTGLFFHSYHEDSLKQAVQTFEQMNFKKETLQTNALKFDQEIFKKQIKRLVDA